MNDTNIKHVSVMMTPADEKVLTRTTRRRKRSMLKGGDTDDSVSANATDISSESSDMNVSSNNSKFNLTNNPTALNNNSYYNNPIPPNNNSLSNNPTLPNNNNMNLKNFNNPTLPNNNANFKDSNNSFSNNPSISNNSNFTVSNNPTLLNTNSFSNNPSLPNNNLFSNNPTLPKNDSNNSNNGSAFNGGGAVRIQTRKRHSKSTIEPKVNVVKPKIIPTKRHATLSKKPKIIISAKGAPHKALQPTSSQTKKRKFTERKVSISMKHASSTRKYRKMIKSKIEDMTDEQVRKTLLAKGLIRSEKKIPSETMRSLLKEYMLLHNSE